MDTRPSAEAFAHLRCNETSPPKISKSYQSPSWDFPYDQLVKQVLFPKALANRSWGTFPPLKT